MGRFVRPEDLTPSIRRPLSVQKKKVVREKQYSVDQQTEGEVRFGGQGKRSAEANFGGRGTQLVKA